MTARIELHVVVTDGRGRSKPSSGLSRWIARAAPAGAHGELVVGLVCDSKMRALNRRFRGIDRPTDVLSFPVTSNSRSVRPERKLLGDVVIATGVAKRQARRAGHEFGVEIRRLALHGLLHLLGYDHTRDNGEMERFERRLWRQGRMKEGAT